MVQEFQVLRCCTCETFQVHQAKKAKKWSCKLCAQKQSYIKVYGQGSGPDCRRQVQKLNMCRGEAADLQQARYIPEESVPEQTYDQQPEQQEFVGDKSSSRWQQYLEDEAEADGEPLVPEGMESFTTDREQFDKGTAAQRKERRQKFRDQRVSQQSGGWYQKPSSEHQALYNSTKSVKLGGSASPSPRCNSTQAPSRPPYNSRQHQQGPPPYPSLQPQQKHPISGEYGSGSYASHQNPKAILDQVSDNDQGTNGHSVQKTTEGQRVSGVWGLSDNNEQVKSPLRRNNISSTKEKSTDDCSRRKTPAAPAASSSSKWSLFIDTSQEQKTDSESDDEDENNADDDINHLTFEEHDRFRDGGLGMRRTFESATNSNVQKKNPTYAETSNFSVRGWSDTPLFSTEDDLDDIISI